MYVVLKVQTFIPPQLSRQSIRLLTEVSLVRVQQGEFNRSMKPDSIGLHGQAVKTPPFHGGNRGSNPLGVTSVSLSEKMSLDDKKNPCYNVRVLYIWRVSQVVRHRSATPLSPVQIWYSPLKNLRNVPEIFFCTFLPCSRKILKANNRQRFAILRAQRKAKINCLSRRRVLIFGLAINGGAK